MKKQGEEAASLARFSDGLSLERQMPAELDLPGHRGRGIKQGLREIIRRLGNNPVQPGKRSGKQVHWTTRGLDNPVRRNAIEIEHIIHMVEIDMVENVGPLHDRTHRDAAI